MTTPASDPTPNERAIIGVDGDLSVTRSGTVAMVTMLADERLNAMRRTFWAALRAVLAELEHDTAIRAVVLTGDGSRAFSAGGDIHGYLALESAADRRAFILDCLRTFQAVETFPKPVIAAVNGLALGGGFELALSCDMIIASQTASFGTPETSLGLVPGFGVVRLLDHLSPGWARYLVFSGERIDAASAQRLGLAQFVVPPDELRERAIAIGEQMGRAAPLALATGKAQINSSLNSRYASSIDAVVMLQSTDDAAEGIAAFRERRPPRFHGR